MTALRARREVAGLVQMNVWIRRDEAEAFRAAVQPFLQRAKVAAAQVPAAKPAAQAKPLLGAAVCFVQRVPPAVVRDRMKAAGWCYDRETDA
jgi:hypothetical protein